jgi:predicted permease
MSSGILPSFLGAVQASLAVLLTISYGAIASRFNLLGSASARDISKVCVRLFLPALMITNLGSELHADTAYRYVPVFGKPNHPPTQEMSTLIQDSVWALIYTLTSMALGWALKRAFKFPAWAIAAICFNNTTALPLLLLQSLDSAGILEDLTMPDSDSPSKALMRAKSYFLVCAMVGNSLTFAVGPKLLDDEESPDQGTDDSKQQDETEASQSDEEHALPKNSSGRTEEEEEEHVNETTTLLPDSIAHRGEVVGNKISQESQKQWSKLPSFIQKSLSAVGAFLNAPLIGAVVGAVIGLAPPLHRVFFNEPNEGGFFKAWLTSSIKNVGELFPALQLVVVGAKLSTALVKMKKGEASGSVPWTPMFLILFIRFILWPM